jgi:hypothetical protein
MLRCERRQPSAVANISPDELKTFQQIGRFFFRIGSLSEAQRTCLAEMAAYYTDSVVKRLLIPIVTQDFVVSLRLVDWFVTNYTKRHRILFSRIDESGAQQLANIYDLYKDYLKIWRRKLFDPFRRKSRIYFVGGCGTIFETTCAQLNFLRWADIYGVLAQVQESKEAVEKDMILRLSEAKEKRRAIGEESDSKHRRCELTPACAIKCQVYHVQQLVSFE